MPSCTYTLKELLPKAVGGSDIEVKHFTQVVAENLGSLKLRLPKPVKVTYHDPCQLVRYLGIVDEPRQILRSIEGLELVEPEWTKGQWATCCGGGGGFEAVFPEFSQILAVNRAKELAETGAGVIVTSCPGCIMQLKTGVAEDQSRHRGPRPGTGRGDGDGRLGVHFQRLQERDHGRRSQRAHPPRPVAAPSRATAATPTRR